ncbi:hypothetical protein GCM10023205_82770 [Yinghuangia aomiensis]|uniref:DUF2169 domain-containing protein n=1 Tax=Yinghuangia aomiensis TaxID=676205 RepID=A0ABP9IFP4_9ACTN
MPGTAWVDPVVLEVGIFAYTGVRGPRWSVDYVTVEGDEDLPAQVLVIDVAPPQWGDPIHCFRKAFQDQDRKNSVRDGDIFVRSGSQTIRPDSDGVGLLSERLTRGGGRLFQVSVNVASGVPIPAVDASEAAVDGWLAVEGSDLLSAVDEASGRPGSAAELARKAVRRGGLTVRDLAAFGRTVPDPRSPQEFREEVAAYLEETRLAVPRALHACAAVRVAPLVLRVTNPLPTNLRGVEVLLHVPGDVEAVLPEETLDEDDEAVLPNPPIPYGPRPAPDPLAGFSVFHAQHWLTAAQARLMVPGRMPMIRPEIRNGGGADIAFVGVDLRPHETVELDGVVLIVRAPAPPAIEATWRATATNHDGIVEGTVTLQVETATRVSLAELLQRDDADR